MNDANYHFEKVYRNIRSKIQAYIYRNANRTYDFSNFRNKNFNWIINLCKNLLNTDIWIKISFTKVLTFLKHCLHDLNFTFTKPFQASPRWHQLKYLIFIRMFLNPTSYILVVYMYVSSFCKMKFFMLKIKVAESWKVFLILIFSKKCAKPLFKKIFNLARKVEG